MDDGRGVAARPRARDQERYWDGSDWTRPGRDQPARPDRVRPPDHVPQLHRAMSEAAEDLDAVEDRLSTLFERTEGPAGSAPRPAPTSTALADGGGGSRRRCCGLLTMTTRSSTSLKTVR